MAYTLDQALAALAKVSYPDTGKDLVALNMIEALKIEGNKLSFSIILPSGNSPFKKSLERACTDSIKQNLGDDVEISIQTVSKVPVGRLDTSEAHKKVLPGVKNIIAVASGKGGVGKSTIATNLAIGLAKTGASVGLLDADIFGPSQPKMFGVEGAAPAIKKIDGKDIIIPTEKFGIKMLSIGFFIRKEDALIWRGAMATSALKQLINDAAWGELDYMVLDLPPGTSDIHLTIVQELPVTGAIIVSTPQDVAIADAIKGIGMFQADKIEVPILGLVENMAWFTPDELPDNKYYLFGKDGVKKLAEEKNMPLLGQIPIVQSIREGGDQGQPAILGDNKMLVTAFEDFTQRAIDQIVLRNKNLAPTKKVEIDPNASCSS